MAELLLQAGFTESVILKEEAGTDTLSSVRAVLSLVRGHEAVYACTSAYHLPRCLILLRLGGVTARACPPPPAATVADRLRQWYWRLREAFALPYDVLLMLWLRVTRQL